MALVSSASSTLKRDKSYLELLSAAARMTGNAHERQLSSSSIDSTDTARVTPAAELVASHAVPTTTTTDCHSPMAPARATPLTEPSSGGHGTHSFDDSISFLQESSPEQGQRLPTLTSVLSHASLPSFVSGAALPTAFLPPREEPLALRPSCWTPRGGAALEAALAQKDQRIAELEAQVARLEGLVEDLRQLPTGKISQIPVE